MTIITVDIPKALWMSLNDRTHWAEKARRTKALRCLGYSRGGSTGRHGTSHVAAFIGYPRNGRADPANAAPTIKALIDGLVDAGVFEDDDSTHLLGPTYLRDKASGQPGMYRVRLVITEQEVPW